MLQFVRETDISRAQFAKHLVLEENARQRDRVIAKKEECDRRREEEVRAYQAVVAQRVQKEREARDRAQAVRAAHSQSKIDETMALKERLIRQEELGRRREAKRLQQVQKRVVEARSLDDRLDASEEALWNFGKENYVLLESANEMFSDNETDPRPHQET